MIDISKLDWGHICTNYDRRKRRLLVVEAMRFVLADLGQLWSTREMTAYIVGHGLTPDPDAAMEATQKLAADLMGMAPFLPEAKQGNPEKVSNRMIRRWTWCKPSEREELETEVQTEEADDE
jgi:hypothetical protein